MSKEDIAWCLFGLSGVIFLVGGIANGDWWAIVASIPWLIGCGLFSWRGRPNN